MIVTQKQFQEQRIKLSLENPDQNAASSEFSVKKLNQYYPSSIFFSYLILGGW